MNAPERIWLRDEGPTIGWRDVGVEDPAGLAAMDPEVIEYVRADLAPRRRHCATCGDAGRVREADGMGVHWRLCTDCRTDPESGAKQGRSDG